MVFVFKKPQNLEPLRFVCFILFSCLLKNISKDYNFDLMFHCYAVVFVFVVVFSCVYVYLHLKNNIFSVRTPTLVKLTSPLGLSENRVGLHGCHAVSTCSKSTGKTLKQSQWSSFYIYILLWQDVKTY